MPYETTDEADGAREGGGFPLASHPHSASVCSAGARSALLSAGGGCPARGRVQSPPSQPYCYTGMHRAEISVR